MKLIKTISKFILLAGAFIIILIGHTSFRITKQDELSVISNKKGAPNEITFSNLQLIFRGEKPRWDDGTKVRIALMKPRTDVGELTARKVYKMSANELNKYWLALVFQGRTSPPKFFNYEDELTKYVSETEGAIGIIRASEKINSSILVYVDGKNSIE